MRISNDEITFKCNDEYLTSVTNRMTCKVIRQVGEEKERALVSSLGEFSWNKDERKGEKSISVNLYRLT